LPACLKAEITRECRRIHQVIVMIAEVKAEQAAALDAEEGQATRLIRLARHRLGECHGTGRRGIFSPFP
jgi:hypothetical protein